MSLFTEALARISKYFQQHRPEVALSLKPGLTIKEIESQVEILPFRLPEVIYELYQWHNGISHEGFTLLDNDQIPDMNFIPHFDFLPLEEAIEASQEIEEFRHEYTSPEDNNCHKPWFPIFGSDDLEYLLVFGHSVDSKDSPVTHCHLGGGSLPTFTYPNLTTFMLIVAECYETNAYYMLKPAKNNSLIYSLEENTEQITEIESKYFQQFSEDIEALIEAISQPRSLLNDDIFSKLYRIKDTRFVEPLIYALHLPLFEVDNEQVNAEIRKQAAIILGEIKDLRAVEPLERALESRLEGDPGYSVAYNAAKALGKIGDPKAVASLKRFVQKIQTVSPSSLHTSTFMAVAALHDILKQANLAIEKLEKMND